MRSGVSRLARCCNKLINIEALSMRLEIAAVVWNDENVNENFWF